MGSMWVPCGPIWGPDSSKIHRNRIVYQIIILCNRFCTNHFVWQSIVLICLAIDVASFFVPSICLQSLWMATTFFCNRCCCEFCVQWFFQPICATIGLCCNHVLCNQADSVWCLLKRYVQTIWKTKKSSIHFLKLKAIAFASFPSNIDFSTNVIYHDMLQTHFYHLFSNS